MRLTLFSTCLIALLETAAPSLSAPVGDLNPSAGSYFEYDSESSNLVQIIDGQQRIWQRPDEALFVQIDYSYEIPPILDSEQLLLRPARFPVGLTSEGVLYRGDPETMSWSRIGQVPEKHSGNASASGALFVSYHSMDKLLFWAGPTAVWYSTDLAQSWHKLGSLPDLPKRLVVSRDLDVVVFTESGLAIEGKVEFASEERLTWNPEAEALPVAANDTVMYGGPGQYTIVPASRNSAARTWRARYGFEAAVGVVDRLSEASVRNTASTPCRWSVISRTPSRGWSNDNYWDFPSTRTEIDLEYKLLAGDKNCRWQAPFRALRFEIRKSDNSKQVFEGGPGNYRFIAYENPALEGVVRAFALRVEDASAYPKYNGHLTAKEGDLWAVLVQAGKNKQSACEVFRSAQRQSTNRSTLTIPVDGSNSGCPQAKATSIGCVSQDARSAGYSTTLLPTAATAVRPRTASGAGECLLPDLP